MRLEGVWKVVKEEPTSLKQSGQLTIKGNTLNNESDGSTLHFKIDPTKNPKWIDMENVFGHNPIPGIYKLDGDRLTIYIITEIVGDEAAERPMSFEEKWPEQIIHFERVKK